MSLYSNAKRMVTMFCTAIVFSTLVILALRLTVFSDMAATSVQVVNPAETAQTGQGGEIGGNGDFPYKLNSKIYFAKPDARGNVLIQNPDTNEYLLRINIMLPETKDSLYYTGTISPGTSIDNASLSAAGQKLETGVYECTAEIAAVDPETMTVVASENKEVSIYIGVKP